MDRFSMYFRYLRRYVNGLDVGIKEREIKDKYQVCDLRNWVGN